jgi:integrase
MPSLFLDSLRDDMRLRGYSIKTEKSYLEWIKRYIYFIDRRHPETAGASEVASILAKLEGRNKLIIVLLYGSGLRVNECLRLRVQDVDIDRLALTVRDGKGRKDRQTLLAAGLRSPVQSAISEAIELQKQEG